MSGRARETNLFRLTQIELALALHHRRTGRYPRRLTELSNVPPASLIDAYTSRPQHFRYVSDGTNYKLYSLGEDRVDNEGVYDFGRADDLSLASFFGEDSG